MAQSQAEFNSGQSLGPPYAPQTWQYGGRPEILPDVPVCAAYIFFYLLAAIFHQTTFLINMKKKGKKFVMSAMTFGFCCARIITFSLRLSWALKPENSKLALVSNIFLNAGIPILYIINLVFAQRILRAQHPRLGWHRSLSIIGKLLLALIILTLTLLIYAGIQQAYTINANTLRAARDIQLYGSTFNCFVAFLPLPVVLLGFILPRRVRTEKFGHGHFKVKVLVLMASASLVTVRTIWSTTTTWLPPVPLSGHPMPWYYEKPIFYTVQLLTELIVVYLFIFVRIDRRFYTPDGIPRGSYVSLPKAMNGRPSPYSTLTNFPTTTTLRIYSDEELFENPPSLADTLHYSSTSLLLDNISGKWQLQRHSIGDVYALAHSTASETRSSSPASIHNFSYTPVTEAASSTPSTWNHQRFEKAKRKRESVALSSNPYMGSSTQRWSTPGGEKGTGKSKAPDLHRPHEKSSLRWSTPAESTAVMEAHVQTIIAPAESNRVGGHTRAATVGTPAADMPRPRTSSTLRLFPTCIPEVPARSAKRAGRNALSGRSSFEEVWE